MAVSRSSQKQTNGKKTTKGKSRNGSLQGVEKEQIIEISDPNVLQSVSGETNQNLKHIEQKLGVRIGRDHESLVITGQDTEVELAYDLLSQITALLEKGEQIFPGDVERALKMLSGNRRMRLADFFRDQVKVAGRKHSIVPKTPLQREYIESIRSNDVVFSVGPAGTGKTYLAMAMAVSALLNKEVNRVVLCRPAVEAGEKLGFLPGDMAEKVNPYLRPLYDALHDMIEYEKAKEMVEKGMIEVAPLAFMRGRTLSKAFVILDEAQNTTPIQMKMFLTRLGPGSKCVVTGDVTQIDLPRGTSSGLHEALRILRNVAGIAMIHFTSEDVIRHPLVSRIVAAYKESEDHKKEG